MENGVYWCIHEHLQNFIEVTHLIEIVIQYTIQQEQVWWEILPSDHHGLQGAHQGDTGGGGSAPG